MHSQAQVTAVILLCSWGRGWISGRAPASDMFHVCQMDVGRTGAACPAWRTALLAAERSWNCAWSWACTLVRRIHACLRSGVHWLAVTYGSPTMSRLMSG